MRDLRRRHGNRADVANYHRTTPFRYWAQQGLFLPISYFVRSRKAMLYACSDTFFVLFVFVCSILYFMCVHWHLLRLSTFRIIGDAVTYKIGFSDTTAAPFQHGYYIATHFFFTMRSIPFDIFLSSFSRLRTITVVFLFVWDSHYFPTRVQQRPVKKSDGNEWMNTQEAIGFRQLFILRAIDFSNLFV